MPSVKLRLPLHVIAVGPRRDGTFNVLFRVRRDAPPGWPSTIPLPRRGKRIGDLTNADEVARIVAEVEGPDGLLAQLDAARSGEPAIVYPAGSLPQIAERWRANWASAGLRARTQDSYAKTLRLLTAWAKAEHYKPLKALTLPAIVKYLRRYDDRPAQRAALRRTLSALCSFAMIEGDIAIHPFGVAPRLSRRKTAKRRVEPWAHADVEAYAAAAIARNWSGGARLLRLMWQTSADATDVVTWRRDKHFRDGERPAIQYARGKTGDPVTIPISLALADELRTCGEIFFVTDPAGRPYRADDVQSDNQRGGHFRTLRDEAVAAGASRLILDHLRHSAVTHALESGARLEHVPSMTGHRGTQMVEQVYAQMTEAQALAVQQARGIVE